MFIRVAAITLIFICTTVGWGILGSTILYRSSVPAQDLRSKVANTWGSPHEQQPPTVSYDGLALVIDGTPVSDFEASGSVKGSKFLAAGGTAEVLVRYRSQGLDRWAYNFAGQPAQVREFNLEMTTNFDDIDFPENTLSPT